MNHKNSGLFMPMSSILYDASWCKGLWVFLDHECPSFGYLNYQGFLKVLKAAKFKRTRGAKTARKTLFLPPGSLRRLRRRPPTPPNLTRVRPTKQTRTRSPGYRHCLNRASDTLSANAGLKTRRLKKKQPTERNYQPKSTTTKFRKAENEGALPQVSMLLEV
ncbi:hypothetical protein HPP92_010658 [Vanilla planifolia]|uniref:Uncharacterized protein n=1 Tax=Vanilla planifolia TaxID=51239 RepID=A0A835V124_VANPL|nr:hypothetical protein HPP92_010658 [Vanilla planifolia]